MAVVLGSTKNLLSQAAKKKGITTINFIIYKARLLDYYWIIIGYYWFFPIAFKYKLQTCYYTHKKGNTPPSNW